jgi:hypothetical protein
MTTLESPLVATDDFQLVVFDLYRDIHKGIRSELFAVTNAAGTLDPHDTFGWMAFAEHVAAVENLLTLHAHHEDTHIDPVLSEHLPELAASVVAEHHVLEGSFAVIAELARSGAQAAAADQRRIAHLAYLQLASFTSGYLAHQAVEEAVIMPLLEQAIGVDAVVGIHVAIISAIPPDVMGQCLTVMLPAMNLDDRAELLGGMRATAPAEAFHGVVDLARSLLAPADFAAVAARLELA